MKTIKAILLCGICIAALQTQAGERNAYLNYKLQNALSVKYTAPVAQATPVVMLPAAKQNDCTKYKRKMIAGWVLFPVGVGTMVGGGYMMYTAAVNVTNRLNQSEDNVVVITGRDKTLFAAGGALTVLGLIMAPTGLGMGINNTIKYHRRCGGGSRALYITPVGRYGAGVAMRF